MGLIAGVGRLISYSSVALLSCYPVSSERWRGDRALEPEAARAWSPSDWTGSAKLIGLGQMLFEEVILSRDSTLSCATCHIPEYGFAEPRPTSHGIGEEARKRNTPSLISVGLYRSAFDWDGRAGTLEEQLEGVFSPPGDMGITLGEAVERLRKNPQYDAAFRRIFGRKPDTRSVVKTLVKFQESLLVGDSRFERFYLENDSMALSDSEKRGWELFRSGRAGCAGCHVPLPEPGGRPDLLVFRDNRFHNLGVGFRDGFMLDVGRYGVTGMASDWGAFATPSLRNVALTAPYMHDGSLATLEDVVAFYARGGIPNPNLDPVVRPVAFSEEERRDLVAFLGTLSTEWLADPGTVALRWAPVGRSIVGRAGSR